VQVEVLKKTANANGRQIAALERILVSKDPEANTSRPGEATPTTPGLRIDPNSAAPTPALTTEHNSPESSSPPSTSLSTSDDAIVDNGKSDAIPSINGHPDVVDADEAER
jgi:mRNA-binding protein PUF3